MQDEVGGKTSGREHTSSQRGLVERSYVIVRVWLEVFLGFEMDYRQGIEHDCWDLVGDAALLPVPPCTIEEQAVDEDSILRWFFNLVSCFLWKEFKSKRQSINSNLVLSSMCL